MRLFPFVAVLAALLLIPSADVLAKHPHSSPPVVAMLAPVDGSGISGTVTLRPDKHGKPTITVAAQGLAQGAQYKSLYYDNATCHLEPYSADDVIGGAAYTADASGHGTTQGKATDRLSQIHSVSVRDATTFDLLACAPVGTS